MFIIIGVIYTPVKSEKIHFRNVIKFFDKNVALELKIPNGSQASVIYPLGHNTKNAKNPNYLLFSMLHTYFFINRFMFDFKLLLKSKFRKIMQCLCN